MMCGEGPCERGTPVAADGRAGILRRQLHHVKLHAAVPGRARRPLPSQEQQSPPRSALPRRRRCRPRPANPNPFSFSFSFSASSSSWSWSQPSPSSPFFTPEAATHELRCGEIPRAGAELSRSVCRPSVSPRNATARRVTVAPTEMTTMHTAEARPVSMSRKDMEMAPSRCRPCPRSTPGRPTAARRACPPRP